MAPKVEVRCEGGMGAVMSRMAFNVNKVRVFGCHSVDGSDNEFHSNGFGVVAPDTR